MKKWYLLLPIALCSLATMAETGKLTLKIVVTGFKSNKGHAMVALCNSSENYKDSEKPFIGKSAAISNTQAVVTIKNLDAGEYAVKVYHDKNNNQKLDTNFFGVPKEAYGFSNNARGKFGPPEWDKVKFKVDKPEQEIKIEVK